MVVQPTSRCASCHRSRLILWVEEVSRYLMIWLKRFLGAGLVPRYGGHIGIDTPQEARPGIRKPGLRALVIFVVMLRSSPVMLWLGIRLRGIYGARRRQSHESSDRRRLSRDADRTSR